MKYLRMIHCVSAISLAAVCLILTSYREWDRTTDLTTTKMMGFSPEGDYFLSDKKSKDSNESFNKLEEYMWEESAYHKLPNNLQRYFKRAFMFTGGNEAIWEHTIKLIRTLEIKEEGSLLLKGKWWVPFTASFHLSANPMNPGFVHQLRLSLPCPLPYLSDLNIHVRYALLNGLESKHMRFMKVVPVLDNSMFSDFQSGALWRWLSLTPLFPTSLLPHDGDGIQWQKYDKSKLLDHVSSAQLLETATSEVMDTEFHFDNNGLISTILGYTFKTDEDGHITKSPWECRWYDYTIMGHGMMVPTRVEYGWLDENGEFLLFYKSTFKSFNYTYF